MFKVNINPGYVDDKIDYQTDMTYIYKSVLLLLSIEKEKQDLQKQIDNFNILISKDM
jgi:hypothetical protein